MLKKIIITLFILGLLGTAGIAGGVWYLLNTPMTPGAAQKKVVIPKGSAIMTIGTKLTNEGVILHPWLFRLAVMLEKTSDKLQAGSFTVSPGQTPRELAVALTKGTEDVWITIPEGLRVEEIAEIAEATLSEFDAKEFISLSKSDEGRLFPDTYLVPKTLSAVELHKLLINTYEDKVLNGLAELFDAQASSEKEVLIMASIVQREAREPEQMRRVAGILQNRMKIKMPLQVDATLQYSKGFDAAKKTWWAPPFSPDKEVKSPFNTYLNVGLPPAPISNPGLDAIKATLDPLESDDLFYLHALDGKMYYAKTLEEHNANITKYLR